MTLTRRIILAFTLIAGLAPAMAQVPSPVPALPDTERRTAYTIAASTCACAVNFSLYGDSTDYANWLEVWLNGTRVNFNDATFGWTITSPTGPLGSIALPITNAVLTFNSAQTGTVQIVGARRPRRTSQFNEGNGVPTRNFNVVLSDLTAQNREVWDKINDVTGRVAMAPPGETLTLLPSAASRSGKLLAFDTNGNPVPTSPGIGTGNVIGPSSSVNSDPACFNGTSGGLLKDCGAIIPVVSIESQGGGCAIADNTSALLSAANSVTGAVRVLFQNFCAYHFIQANAISFSKPVMLEGTGVAATVLAYNPSADGTFLNWSNGLNVLFAAGGAGVKGLTITSADTTHNKVAISYSDVSGFNFTDASIGWPFGSFTGGFITGSIGYYPHGREHDITARVSIQADQPIQVGMNPHSYLSTDHYHWSDLYLSSGAGFPNIKVDPGVVVTDWTFDGRESWVLGNQGFYYPGGEAADFVSAVVSGGTGYTTGQVLTVAGGTCSTPITITVLSVSGGAIQTASIANPGACSATPSNPVSVTTGSATFSLTLVAGFRLSFANVRTEQGSSNAAYTFFISPASLQGLTITNSAMDSFRCGAFLANTINATIQQSTYLAQSGGCGVAVNATSANHNDMLSYKDDFWLSGVTQNTTGMNPVFSSASPTGSSATVPPNALYSSSISLTNFINIALSGGQTYGGTNGSVTLSTPTAVNSNLSDIWGTVAGTVAASATSPIVENATTGTVSCPTCAITTNGGAITGTAPISVSAAGAVSLNNTTVTPNSYGSSTVSPTFTVDAQGRLTVAANVTITPAIGSVTGIGTGLATPLTQPINANGGVATVITQTPTIADGSGASLTLTVAQEGFQVGPFVHQLVTVTYPTTASSANAQLNGLAITIPNRATAAQCFISSSNVGFNMAVTAIQNSKNVYFSNIGNINHLTNANLSTTTTTFECIYPAT